MRDAVVVEGREARCQDAKLGDGGYVAATFGFTAKVNRPVKPEGLEEGEDKRSEAKRAGEENSVGNQNYDREFDHTNEDIAS